MTYLHFVTLNTGSREAMDPPDAAVTHSAALDLGRALRDGQTPIAAQPGHWIKALTVGRALLCTIYQGEDLALTTFGVSARQRGAEPLWRLMHETSPDHGLVTGPDDMPPSPWCAVRVEAGLLEAHGQPWVWLAAYELEVATAWIERRHRDA